MTSKILITAIITSFICSCEKQSKNEITVADLLKAHDMISFMVKLPQDIGEKDFTCLELYDEKGVVDTAQFAYGLKASELLKVFIHKNGGDYRYSVVADSMSVNDIKLNNGMAKLFTWRGDSITNVYSVGDPLAVFTIDREASLMRPTGDDVSLRVVIKKGSEQAATSNGG